MASQNGANHEEPLMNLPADFRDTCSFSVSDGTSIAVRQSVPRVDSTLGGKQATSATFPTVLFVHGLGEHSGRYDEVAQAFADTGFRFVAYDQRGHGLSSGRRCDCESLDQLCNDLDQVLRRINADSSLSATFLYGHSFGGMVVLWYLLTRVAKARSACKIHGALVTSPLIHAQNPPPPMIITLGRLAARIWPTLTFYSRIKGEQLSQVPKYVERFHADPFCQGRVTARMGRQILDAGDQLLSQANRLPVAVQLHHGDADPVTSWSASQSFSQEAGAQCEFVSWEGQRHELHHEVVREELFATMLRWLEKQAPSEEA